MLKIYHPYINFSYIDIHNVNYQMSKKNSNKRDNKRSFKTKITRFGYIINKSEFSEDLLEEIRKELRVCPKVLKAYQSVAAKKAWSVFVENGKLLSVPKYYGLNKLGEPEKNLLETYDYPQRDMHYLGLLRPNQQIIVDKVIQGFEKQRGGVLVAGCGSGKTNMAIYIACHYKIKTLFIVHKFFLKNQIMDRIKSTTNIEDVGTIQGDKVDTDHPFVIGMVQSLYTRDYDDKIFRDFGMVIIDEVHHMGARKFSEVFLKIGAKYMLGISAEKERNDGLYKIINWYMGPFHHVEEQKPNDMVVVKRFNYSTANKERIKTIINKYTKEPDRSTMITNLICIRRRNNFILNLLLELFDMGKNVLLLTGRLDQIKRFEKKLGENEYTKNSFGLYIGGMSESDLAISATKQLILGTFSMAEEGLDIDGLNVVIFATPKSSIKQSVGRILRKEIYEEHPIVIDIVDEDNSIFKKQAYTRSKYYQKQHYAIQEFNVADYTKKSYIDWDDTNELRKALTQKVTKPKKQTRNYVPTDELIIECLDD